MVLRGRKSLSGELPGCGQPGGTATERGNRGDQLALTEQGRPASFQDADSPPPPLSTWPLAVMPSAPGPPMTLGNMRALGVRLRVSQTENPGRAGVLFEVSAMLSSNSLKSEYHDPWLSPRTQETYSISQPNSGTRIGRM